MKPETMKARAMTDAELRTNRIELGKTIPAAQALLSAIQREHRRRKRANHAPKKEPSE